MALKQLTRLANQAAKSLRSTLRRLPGGQEFLALGALLFVEATNALSGDATQPSAIRATLEISADEHGAARTLSRAAWTASEAQGQAKPPVRLVRAAESPRGWGRSRSGAAGCKRCCRGAKPAPNGDRSERRRGQFPRLDALQEVIDVEVGALARRRLLRHRSLRLCPRGGKIYWLRSMYRLPWVP